MTPESATTFAEQAPARPKSALVLNRIALFLGFVGVFIAGVLSLGHALARSVPCGETGGCDTIATHPSSLIFGIPVAYLGLGAYLTLAAISAVRAFAGLAKTQKLGYAALAISGVGALFSFYLQYLALTQIHAFCVWCLASAITMCLSFLVQAGLAQAALPAEVAGRKDADVGFTAALACLALLGIGAESLNFVHHAPSITGPALEVEKKVVTLDSMKQGPDSAPVKIVEFSDLLCGGCRHMYPEVKKFVAESGGKAQLIFRHYPLYRNPDHHMSLPGAFLAEYATEKGKGWQFVEAMYQVDPDDLQNLGQVMDVAKSVGLDINDAQARMKDSDPAYAKVLRDIDTAKSIDIHETPTFVIFAPGQQPVAVLAHELTPQLKKPEYQQFLHPNAK